MNNADLSWMLVSTLLVLMMAAPGLALFYSGMVRQKNALSMLSQTLLVFSLGVVLWFIYGYSLAFTAGNPLIGGFDKVLFNGMFTAADQQFSMSGTLPELLFASFQATFAGLTCALVVGSLAERTRLSAILVFTVIWFTLAYLPICHMVWVCRWTERRFAQHPWRVGLCGRNGRTHQCWYCGSGRSLDDWPTLELPS
jgi:Amt family ammonium transporter